MKDLDASGLRRIQHDAEVARAARWEEAARRLKLAGVPDTLLLTARQAHDLVRTARLN